MSALKVLFLSSDTGGGHRASAESLAAQFTILFPGTTYDLLDLVSKDSLPPYNKLVDSYKHLSAYPNQWNVVFKFSNSRAFEFFFDVTQKATCEKAMRKSIMEYKPDVVVSVHPLMTNVPVLCCERISKETGRHLPIFTVVTDLGSAHCLWFANGVDKMFIASDQIRHLAKARGKVPDEKLVQIGLPIRHQFAEQADKLGDRMSPEGKEYQKTMRGELGLPEVDKKTILVMGGGEGVGSLSNIVDAMYGEFVDQGIDALILVVCGRNEKLKSDLENKDWSTVVKEFYEKRERKKIGHSLKGLRLANCVSGTPPTASAPVGGSIVTVSSGCMEGSVTQQIKRILSSSSLSKENAMGSPEMIATANGEYDDCPDVNRLPTMTESNEFDDGKKANEGELEVDFPRRSTSIGKRGQVNVVGLGFVNRMADYMVAADVLVSKAGPGTIAEAASLSLPVMLTSFLPGQEEGNVDFVIEGKFGAFISDKDTAGIAEEVGHWLIDEEKLTDMSIQAKANGAPNAARDIVKQIGEISVKWKKINDEREKLNMEAQNLINGIPSNDEGET